MNNKKEINNTSYSSLDAFYYFTQSWKLKTHNGAKNKKDATQKQF